MTHKPARPEGYGYEFVPAMDSPKGKTAANWRISDPFDNRIATCYDEANCRQIVAALNGAPIVSDPAAVQIIREQAAIVADRAKHSSMSPGVAATLNLAAVSITAAVDAIALADRKLEGGGGPVEFRREGALESDPYARGGFSFADLVDYSAQEVTYHDAASGIMRSVRDRVLDDVHAAHRMLDALGIAGGPLTARVGLALGWQVLERTGRLTAGGVPPVDIRAFDDAGREARPRRTHGSGEPLADAGDVRIPEPDEVLEVLDQLSGEELFRLFDAVKVLPANTLEALDWNLMDAVDTRRMVATCCAIALENGRLGELAKAAREVLARKVGS